MDYRCVTVNHVANFWSLFDKQVENILHKEHGMLKVSV